MPMHLPDAPAPAEPWWHLGDGDDEDESDHRRLGLGASPKPQHCGATEKKCRGRDILSVKQQRLIHSYAKLTGSELPSEIETMRPGAADKWLAASWELWRSMGHPTA